MKKYEIGYRIINDNFSFDANNINTIVDILKHVNSNSYQLYKVYLRTDNDSIKVINSKLIKCFNDHIELINYIKSL